MSRPEDDAPEVDDWFEEAPTSERQPAVRRRPGLPPPPERRPPAVFLLAAIALLLVLVVAIVAVTRGDDEPTDQAATELPTTAEPEDTVTTAPETEPLPTVPTEAVIRPGDEGEQVQTLQEALVRLGYDPGEPDGNYGPATVEAVRSFQTTAGLPADGVAGPDTLNAINAALQAQG